MSNDTIHSGDHAEAIAAALTGINDLDTRLNQNECHLRGSVEVWSDSGFRLGLLVYEDDFWRFRLDYSEETA